MECSAIDRRFPVQQISHDRWRSATEANLAADFLAGYEPWTTAFTDSRPDWQEFGEFLRASHTDELAQFAARHREGSLAFLVMMLTGACNADCPICFTDRRRKRGEMAPELRDRVVRQAAALGADYVYVPGEGEPTIDRGWWEFLDSCRSAGLHAIVFTNGLIFSDPATSRKYWDCEPADTVARLADYPVSLYVKMWSTRPELVGEMLAIDAAKYRFTDYDGCPVPAGMARLLEVLPRQRLGIEVVVERRNADEVVDTIVPFAQRHGLAQIVEMVQHNGRIFGDGSYDPSPAQAAAVRPFLSPTSCTVATCKAVVTTQGYLSPRIAILEPQLPRPPRRVDEGELWELLHHTDYLVHRRYELSCLCESEPAALAQVGAGALVGPTSVVPAELGGAAEQPARSPQPSTVDLPAVDHAFGRDRSVAELSRGLADHGERVRVVGRALPSGPGLFELADGPTTVTIAGLDVPEYAWVRVSGSWDAVRAAIRADGAEALTEQVGEPANTLVAEFAAVREPDRLVPVVRRAAVVAALRGLLTERGYLEVTTPMLQAAAEMCHVNQATTAPILGRRFQLRTDPEEYLKRYLSAGLAAVYEVSTNVRADQPDGHHLVEFQSLEFYRRLMSFDETIMMADELVRTGLRVAGGEQVTWAGSRIDTGVPFPRIRFNELFCTTTGIDLADPACATATGLATRLAEAGYPVRVAEGLTSWRRSVLDAALDEHVLPLLRRPTWVTHFPIDLGLSARPDPADPRNALRAELYLPTGLELAHVYDNLTDGAQLRARYDTRRSHRVAAGLSYVPTNEPLMVSAECAMPPMAGGAVGMDRVLMVALGHDQVGAGLLFGREGFTLPPRPKASLCGVAGGCGSCGGGCH